MGKHFLIWGGQRTDIALDAGKMDGGLVFLFQIIIDIVYQQRVDKVINYLHVINSFISLKIFIINSSWDRHGIIQMLNGKDTEIGEFMFTHPFEQQQNIHLFHQISTFQGENN